MTRYPRRISTRLLLGLCGSTLLLALAAPVGAWACSKHGTNAGNEISVECGSTPDVQFASGEPGHRWLTAQGSFADDRAALDSTAQVATA